MQDIAELYEEYINTISDAGAVLGKPTLFEIAAMLQQIPENAAIADFGSGFSSVLLRMHQQTRPQTLVYSVDTDPYWLEKTYMFLEYANLPPDYLLLWADYHLIKDIKFDFIVFDIGSGNERHHYLPPILKNNVKNSTILLFDDMHKSALGASVTHCLRDHFRFHKWVSLKEETKDQFGRWASYATNFQK